MFFFLPAPRMAREGLPGGKMHVIPTSEGADQRLPGVPPPRRSLPFFLEVFLRGRFFPFPGRLPRITADTTMYMTVAAAAVMSMPMKKSLLVNSLTLSNT